MENTSNDKQGQLEMKFSKPLGSVLSCYSKAYMFFDALNSKGNLALYFAT